MNRTLLLVLFSLSALIAQAQWTPGRYMRQATTRILAYAKVLEERSSYYGFRNGLCFLGAGLSANAYSSINMSLSSSNTYIFIGGGDDDATDIDIKILNSYGTVVASDVKADNFPVVTFKPSYSGTYSVRLENRSTGMVYCSLAILQDGGVALRSSNLDDAINRIFTVGTNIYNRVGSLSFHSGSNVWCFYGYALPQGDNATINNIDLGYGLRHIIAASDYRSSDIDLCLTNSNATSELRCDTETDTTPIVRYTASNSYNYGLKLKNIRSNGISFSLACILKED